MNVAENNGQIIFIFHLQSMNPIWKKALYVHLL